MTCPECGAVVHPSDRFCSICGTPLPPPDEADDPGTDRADAPTEAVEQPSPAPAPLFPDSGEAAREWDDTPTAAYRAPETYDEESLRAGSAAGSAPGDDDRADTSELGGLLPLSAYPDVHRPGGGYPEREEGWAGEEPARPASRRGCLGMVALGLVGLLMLAGLIWFFGSGDDSGSGTAGSQSQGASAGSAGPSGSLPSGDSSDGPQPTQRAATAKKCGAADGATAWSGNDVTSCDFAVATAQALMASSEDLPATITARSPVTKKDYEMTCENTLPVVCRGGNNALVYVDVPR